VPGGWNLHPGYWNWSVSGLSTVRGYYVNGTDIEIGAVVCKNGRTTATTCGHVESNNNPYPLDDPANGNPVTQNMLLIRNMCVQGGDSGSPVTRADSEIAVGIISSGRCGEYGLTEGSAEPVGRALAQHGVAIYGC